MKFVEYPDADMMLIDLADTLASELNMALMTHERASLAVPGGTSPGPIFDVLSAVHLDWDRVDVVLTDERWVPGDHARSNTKMLYERLLTDNAARANYISLYTGDATPEAGAEAIRDQVHALLPISVLLMGMGADMHCASLFPGSDHLAAALADDAPEVLAMHGGENARVAGHLDRAGPEGRIVAASGNLRGPKASGAGPRGAAGRSDAGPDFRDVTGYDCALGGVTGMDVWTPLAAHHRQTQSRPILTLFDEPGRAQAFSASADKMLFDYSKTNIDEVARKL